MLRFPKEISEFTIASKRGVLDVGLQPQHVAQAGFGEPDDVVVLVFGPGDVAKLGVAGHVSPSASAPTTYGLLVAPTPEFPAKTCAQKPRWRFDSGFRNVAKINGFPLRRPSLGQAVSGVTRMTMP